MSSANNGNPSTDIRNLGVIEDFVPFWYWDSQGTLQARVEDGRWQWKSRLEIVDPFGNSLQETDPLQRHSAMLYGYNHQMPVSEASNSELRQIAFDGFEDYSVNPSPLSLVDYGWTNREHPCNIPSGCRLLKYGQLTELPPNRVSVTRSESHTGLSSLRLLCQTATLVLATQDPNCTGSLPSATSCQSCVPSFRPAPGEEYVISCWAKTANIGTAQQQFVPSLRISFLSQNVAQAVGTLNWQPSGPVIDGWQRIWGTFTVPSSESVGFRLQFVGPAIQGSLNTVYYDDLRIHPVRASMRSMAYHPWSLRLMAVLDENNYATFYEYDIQGDLIRVKRETERGIMTVQEGRNNMPRRNIFQP
jgi:hypothetical protein